MDARTRIVTRVAQELKDGDVVNLGIGMPTLVANNVPEGIRIFLQSENGIIGMGSAPAEGEEDTDIINAGGKYVTVNPGAAFFDSATSFGIIRGGHVNLTVLGALQVDQKGNLASHIIPGKMVPGMGGAMDLVTGSKKVIIAMTHAAKDGSAKILKELTLPTTAVEAVDMIVTELAVMVFTENGLVLTEIAESTTLEEIKACTEADFTVAADLKTF